MTTQDQEALEQIRQGFQNIIPRIIQEGSNVKITQGTETFILPINHTVVARTILQ